MMTRAEWDKFLENEWPQHRKETVEAMRKIDEIHLSIGAIKNDTRHLQMLDAIAKILGEVKDSLIATLSGKDIISTAAANEMLQAQQKAYSGIITSLCKIFGVILLLLVGLKTFAPHWFS